MRLAFSIPGKPKGKERPRVAPGQSRPYTPKQTVEAEKAIRALFLEKFPDHQPWTGPVMLRFTAVFEVPKSWPAELRAAALAGEVFAICKPDKDNIEKLIVDAISEEPKSGRRIAWIDDAQLQGGGVKRYGTHERVDVVLEFLADMRKLPPEVILPRCVFWAIRHLSPGAVVRLIDWLREELSRGQEPGRPAAPGGAGTGGTAAAGGDERLAGGGGRGRDAPPHIADAPRPTAADPAAGLARHAEDEADREPEPADLPDDGW